MKYNYQKPQVVIESSILEECVLAGSDRNLRGGPYENEDGGKTIQGGIVDNSTIDYDPFTKGQGTGTIRSNSGLWDE